MVPGLDAAATNADVLTLVQRGGLTSMSNIILTIFCAYSFAGIAEEAGFMEKIIDAVIGKIKTRGATVAAGICTAITLTIIGVSGYISLIMTGELFRKPYLKWRMDLSVLSRTCEDGGTMICSIVPFSTSGLFYAGALGVPCTLLSALALYGLYLPHSGHYLRLYRHWHQDDLSGGG